MQKRIGIYGGTFDPIHIGHLMVAEAARQDCNLEKVLFIPSNNPPHKDDEDITPAAHRFEMARLAVADNPYFNISRIEIDRVGINYTVDTLRMLQETYSEDYDLWLVIGGDAFLQIETWKNFQEIMGMCDLAVYKRSDFSQDRYNTLAENLRKKMNTKIMFLDAPRLDISSTDIRSRVSKGKSTRYMVSKEVGEYINKNGIYS